MAGGEPARSHSTQARGLVDGWVARFDAELLIVGATVALLLFYYIARADTIGVFSPPRGWAPMTRPPLAAPLHFALSALLLGLFPVLLARRATGLSLRQLGLGLGNLRHGLLLLAGGIPLAILAGATGAATPALRAVYPLDPAIARETFLGYALMQFLYFGAWEVLFRGVLLLGLQPRLGGGVANAVQTALSVGAHFGRALNETLAALPAGLVFGWVSVRLRSIWYVAVIHWVVGISMDWFIIGRMGK